MMEQLAVQSFTRDEIRLKTRLMKCCGLVWVREGARRQKGEMKVFLDIGAGEGAQDVRWRENWLNDSEKS